MPKSAETVDNDRDQKVGQWLRIFPLLFFGLIAWFVLLGCFVMAAIQFVVVIVTDEPNQQLREFGARIGAYVREVIEYMIYGCDQMPFPFAPFPGTKPKPARRKTTKSAKTANK